LSFIAASAFFLPSFLFNYSLLTKNKKTKNPNIYIYIYRERERERERRGLFQLEKEEEEEEEDVNENKGGGGQVRAGAERSVGCRYTGQNHERKRDAELHRRT
jgi:hypothetical protein